MIKSTPTEMPIEREKALRKWLSKPEAADLRKIAESKLAEYQVKAANAAVKSKDVPEGPEQEEAAIVKMEKGAIVSAQRYQTFLEVLDEIASQDDGFTLTHLSC